jgi:3',5'-cyclic-AMP phosphodiesterase
MATTRVLQLTDLHLFADRARRLMGIPTRELLLTVTAHVQRSGVEVDHVVVTGDHTHDELPETYRAVREILEPWGDRLWLVPGNHDDRTALREAFADRVGGTGADRVEFAFRAGAWLCLGLDTHVPGSVAGRIDASQVDRIRDEIDRHRPAHVALFMHHPPVELGCTWLDRIGLEGRELLQQLIVEDARIRLACCGHVHHESSHVVGAATIVTTPSTGLQFDPVGDSATFATAPPGYRLIELTDDGCTTEVVRLPQPPYTPTEE